MPDMPTPPVLHVRAAVAPLHHEARVSSMQVSQALRGFALEELERTDDWRRVRAPDGYEGWIHRGYVDEDAADAWREPRLSLGCTVLADRRPLRLPVGALVRRGEQVLVGQAVDDSGWIERFPVRADAIVASAERWFGGTSYQWGGTTPWGADCSGMTQAVFRLHHRALPRDAWQQAALAGPAWSPVAGGLDALAAGDLLFFSDRPDRRITHVGLASGPARMMHLALGRGGWAHERLDDAADGYVRALRERFTHALRPAL